MPPDTGIMNTVLQTFLDQISIGVGVVGFDARGLLGILALMELILVAVWWAYSGNEALSRLLRKVLTIFFFIWVIDNYSYILSWVTDGFVYTGQRAAGGAAVDINDPSGIMWSGFQVVKPILEHARAQPSFFGGFFDALVSLISAFLILFAYFILAVQIFLTRIEFALISTLGLILVPFGVFKYTSFMAEKVFGAVISFGVKLMVLAFIISVGFPLMQTLSVPPDPSWPEMLSIMFGSLAMALLAIHAPGVASGLLSGGPSLTAGSAAGAGMAVGAAGVATMLGGAGAFAAGRGAVGTAVQATRAAASMGGSGAAVVGAGKASAESGKGLSGMVHNYQKQTGTTIGAIGAGGKATYNAAASTITDFKNRVKGGLSTSYAAGKDRVNRNLQTKVTDPLQDSDKAEFHTQPPGGNFADSTATKSRGGKFSRATSAVNIAASSTHSSQPSAGMQARVGDEDRDG